MVPHESILKHILCGLDYIKGVVPHKSLLNMYLSNLCYLDHDKDVVPHKYLLKIEFNSYDVLLII